MIGALAPVTGFTVNSLSSTVLSTIRVLPSAVAAMPFRLRPAVEKAATGPLRGIVTARSRRPNGPLAHDDENSARLRETLRVFLQENLSYKATAERLVLHKNTVQYRVRKAEESLQHPVAQDRLLIELALLATQRLGTAVLRPGAGVRA